MCQTDTLFLSTMWLLLSKQYYFVVSMLLKICNKKELCTYILANRTQWCRKTTALMSICICSCECLIRLGGVTCFRVVSLGPSTATPCPSCPSPTNTYSTVAPTSSPSTAALRKYPQTKHCFMISINYKLF